MKGRRRKAKVGARKAAARRRPASRARPRVTQTTETVASLKRSLAEGMEQQAATSEVLKVISRSPGDLVPVFQAMLGNATRLCEARFGVLWLYDGKLFRLAATHGVPPALMDVLEKRGPNMAPPGSPLRRLLDTGELVHASDEMAEPLPGVAARFGGARSLLAVPMRNDSGLVGAFIIYRQEVRPFTDKQIALVTNFTDQAVIAIENTRLLNELRHRTDDLSESLEQQTAISEILRVISNSPSDVQPVLDSVAEHAGRICEAQIVDIVLARENTMSVAASFGDMGRPTGQTLALDRSSVMGRSIVDRKPVQVDDLMNAGDEFPLGRQLAEKYGHRTILGVPLMREGRALGTILVRRSEVRPFDRKDIALLTTFADQAAIAIENVRLFDEVQKRTEDLSEALEQQTATSEVLNVISRSPGTLSPVFSSILSNAARICEAKYGMLWLTEGDGFRSVATHDIPAALVQEREREQIIHPGEDVPLGRLRRTKELIHIADIRTDQAYAAGFGPFLALADMGGARTFLLVPMLKDEHLVGAIAIYRKEVRPFAEKQVELVQNFAAQAVIAIENTRLLNELRQRTDDLSEALEQQTATAEILRVIGSSLSDTQPVFDAIVQAGLALFPGAATSIELVDNGQVIAVAIAAEDATGVENWRKIFPFPLTREYMAGVAILDRRTVDVADARAGADTREDADAISAGRRNFLKSGYRAVTKVPMIHRGTAIGVLSVARPKPGLLSGKQLDILKTFADQAVIAIENARLLHELRQRTDDLSEALEQQTATADVLKVISRSAYDLQSVLDSLLRTAGRLCDADMGTITQKRGDRFYRAVSFGFPTAFIEYIKDRPVEPGRTTGTGRALVEGKIVHIPDVHSDPEFDWPEAQKLGGFRTMLGVPMLREGVPVGVMALTRSEVRPFTDKQIELVATFADQAAIAIENVRLFDEIQDKSHQLEEASQHKSRFLANMSHELRTPLNAILGYTELIQDSVYGEPPEKMQSVLERIQRNGKHLLGLINDVLDLSKIEAGQLVLNLDSYSIRDVVHGVYSAVEPLAAKKNLALKVEMPKDLPSGRGDERRLTQVLLNLVGNAIKFTDQGEVSIKASAGNGTYSLAVRDTGPGISEADQSKLFQEFQQADSSITKAKGGTGLGLAISRRIVEMHGGRIWVESRPGQGSVFSLTLPIKAEQITRQP
jgi:signal transduction histidine kinase